MKAVLDGIRVVDCSTAHVGPYAAAMLGELGADVIHVEERGVGDMVRGLTHFMGIPEVIDGRSIQFEQFNVNKRSLAVDLKKPEGKEIVYRLIEKADIFITNFRDKAIQRLGLDYPTLKRVNPKIIYVAANALGSKGPDSDVPGYELVGLARSGVLMSSGEEGMPPVSPTVGLGDRIAAIYSAFGAIVALLARERLGVSQEVRTSILAGMLSLESWSVLPALFHKVDPTRQRRAAARNPLYNWYQCKDGIWVALGMVQHERYWPLFCKVMGIPELEKDKGFDDAESRAENCEAFISILDKIFSTKSFKEWEQLFKENDFLFSKVNRLTDLVSDPQVLANGYIRQWDHPHWGSVDFTGFYYSLSETPLSIRSPAPELGEHNEEILLEYGYSWTDIAKFRELEVI